MNEQGDLIVGGAAQGELVRHQPNIAEMLDKAIERNIDPASIESLSKVFLQHEDRANAREFAAAMSRFSKACPPVPKTRVRVLNKGGAKSLYASYEDVQKHIQQFLDDEGLSYTFDQSETDKAVTVKCRVQHINGHAKESSYTQPKASASGATADVLTLIATTTAMRRVLAMAFPVVVSNDAEDDPGMMPVSPEQLAVLEDLFAKIDPESQRRMLANVIREESLDKVKAGGFQYVKSLLEGKINKGVR